MIDEKPSKFIFVQRDRSAASAGGDSTRGHRGQWARQGRELHIIWDSGEYSILSETERGYTYKIVDSGEVIEEDATPAVSAIRTSDSQVPSAWLESYLAEREVTSAASHSPAARVLGHFTVGIGLSAAVRPFLNALASSALAGSPHQLIAHWMASGVRVVRIFSCVG